ncbi:lipopolysaccharide biosynthesis protein [Gloeocapsopsis dulcis]|uniref:Lipopolysaccharide biosynthesis protein n=1 Tax=Gloeocapsopsis dulcis AAB1 = 1H9 TaxID=1433147 RepID=A0A6N8FTK8_9CHRO|nr:lipopolysaccharide biosynthesis protein [Gloeocapsopsis dulcis]MUL36281.1 lipopolysaccharide biosynthesis protein [Gloeocapsopsis dulcis AAB1 = 1H9]WNN89608.1 lipopolysaccharide biosynthesis protein [Gloeocapsopsis dulcis]
MSFIEQPISKLKQKLSNQFISNLGWLSSAEVVTRVFRIGITAIVARFLTPYDYGLIAIITTINEFARVLMEVGIGAKIIQSDFKDLKQLCNSAYWLNWIIYTGIFVIQCLAAFPIAWFYRDTQLIFPICVAAIPYLIWPIAAIQCVLIQKENKLKILAISNTIKNLGSYTLLGIFAALGMGVWSFVLSWVLVAPIDVFIYYTYHSWRPNIEINTKYWKEFFRFGKNIFGTHLLKTLRNNLDYLIVGRFLGIKELGIYFFGFNAGLGISLSFISVLNTALFPHLCAASSNRFELKKHYLHSLKAIAAIIMPLVLLQTSLAPFYVPIVFGQKWVVAIPILMLICLSAIPRAFADAASLLLVAIGKPNLDLSWNVVFTTIFTTALLIGIHGQAIGVATTVFLVHVVTIPLFIYWTTAYVFHRTKNT